jgi:small subunit ribosomal protein S11
MAQQNIKSDAKVSKAKARKKRKLADVNGAAHIHSTVNNTIVTITDLNGNAIT